MAGSASADEYGAMLGYLTESRVDGQAFAGASGAIALNLASGDLNQQVNLRAISTGPRALAHADVRQARSRDAADAPDVAAAVIADGAFAGASGLAGINQASGSGNSAFNAVAVALAQQGIRESDDDGTLASAFASAGQQHGFERGGTTAGRRVASVESTALQGFEGVLQLNQVAGAGNDTGNALSMSLASGP
ncbi:hypothetical protein H0E82_00805 [Luteimonas sp. SJ-16]|uniref:Adhesin n=2 Tax=Luteimonas deserti TaxID=2752306 RepID=A0A7Z0QND2_9GAMM|nr:hypothetical protein [Luteimonas deserti]NYZ61304.1 hypothetical protein [Luteimonas deserti]